MSNQKNILIVDDEPKIVEVLRSFLESKGFKIFTAENGIQAFDIFAKESISLILLDLMLPGMSGEEICATIRKKSRVPIIMLTAKVEETDMLTGLGIGADDYITKPFSLKALNARIEAVIRRSSDDLIPLYKKNSFGQGDLDIDFESRTVKKMNIPVDLTPIEFKILSALIKYPNKIFTRDELIEKALGENYKGYDRTIDSHIKNLRNKVESDSRNPIYVLTVHGVGYKFGGE
ncbi:MAG: two component transcriptional regulator, winged helix family [Bacillales bacterium]|jgi:DNA-binding response OmpR family regulator|nr:two component transcriptional regulator, winged helix family [Bacillales bacterium]